MKPWIGRYLGDKSGVTAIEYALIAALIAIGSLVGLMAYGDALLAWYENIRTGIEGA